MTSLNVCNLPHDLEWINECRHKNLQWDQNIDKVRSKISRVISGLRQARDYVTLFKCTKKYIALKSMPVLKQKPKGHLLTKPLHDHFIGIGFPCSMSSGILHYLCPSYNHHLFQTYKPVRSSRSSTLNLLISDTQIKAKILSDDHAFSFCAPKLCNDSPEHIECKMEFEYSFF